MEVEGREVFDGDERKVGKDKERLKRENERVCLPGTLPRQPFKNPGVA